MAKLKTVGYILVASIFQVPFIYGVCPNGWLRHGATCYHISHDTEPMLLASISCQQMGGTLAEIETAEESAYLAANIKNLFSYYYIGLNDIQEETFWEWHGSKKPLHGYTNWNPGEPNSGNDENCVVLGNDNGKWRDTTCHNNFRYICEKLDTDSEIRMDKKNGLIIAI